MKPHPTAPLLAALAAAVLGVSAPPTFAAPAAGPLRVLASNPRYFTDGSGKPIYLTGSHTWANFAMDQGDGDPPGPFDYDGFLDFLVTHHHNFFRGWVWDVPYSKQGNNGGPHRFGPMPWPRTGPGLATDGKPKFDLSKFDQAYFDRVRARTIAARDRGLYVAVMLFQGYAWQFNRNPNDGFPYDGRNNINGVDAGPGHGAALLDSPTVTARQEEYVRKVIDTVNDLDNVLYEIANEAGPYATKWQYHMIDYIQRYERTKLKQHPVGMTFQFKGGTNEELFASNAEWISPYGEDAYISDPPAADGRKVVLSDTDHFYGWKALKKDGPAKHQAWVWKNLCRGNQTLFMDPYLARTTGSNVGRNEPLGTNPREPYFGLKPDPYWDTLRTAMGRTRTWADKIDLTAMIPHNELASTTYCLAAPRREYLIYNPGPEKPFTVQLTEGTYALEWFNPTTGKSAGTERLEVGNGTRKFSAPFEGDAVLHVKRSSKP